MQLPRKHNIVRMVDIDGTILWRNGEIMLHDPRPLEDAVETVNEWYEQGDYIIIWTARHPVYEELTRKELDQVGLKYHDLQWKPYAGSIHIYDDADIIFHPVIRNQGIGKLEE